MATLEKIRSKSVLLVVIIALALLAFILGDAITNGRNLFGNDSTVAKVGKEKIEYPEYKNALDETKRAYPNAGDTELGPQALNYLVSQRLIDNAVGNVGITATPELLRYYMIESPNYMTPDMQQIIFSLQQVGIPVNTPAEAHKAIFQPQTYNLNDKQVEAFQQAWIAMENKYTVDIARDLYITLFNNSYKANDLDVAMMRRNMARAANVKVAKKAYDENDVKAQKVDDSDLKKAYDEDKENYSIIEETREISFIAVEVLPSEKDVEASKTLASEVMKNLASNQPIKDKGVSVQSFSGVASKVQDASLRNFLENAPVDSVARLSDVNGFTIAKLNKRYNEVDAVTVGVLTMADEKETIDEVLAYTASGQSLDSLTAKFPTVQYNVEEVNFFDGENSAPKYLGLEEAKYDSLYNNPGKFLEIYKDQGQVMYWSIQNQGDEAAITDYELVTYQLHPSEATLEQAREQLQNFINTNNTAEKFEKNARAAKYNVEEINITSSTPALPNGFNGYYPDSRPVVHWAMVTGKDGEVSKIYQNRDLNNPVLYVAAIDGSYKDYLPVESRTAKRALTTKVQKQKTGEAYAKKYAKNTVEESAQAMGVDKYENPSLHHYGDGVVTDAKVRGRIMGSKASAKPQVVKGDDALYVFVVTEVVDEPLETSDEELANRAKNLYMKNFNSVLLGKDKIENNIFKFEAEE